MYEGLKKKNQDQQEINITLAYFIDVKDHRFLSREEEYELAETIKKYGVDSPQGEKARDQFILTNLKLVVHFAKKFRGQGLSFLDLIQEGNLGLIRAIPRFDHTRGRRFGTYASWWVKQAMQRAIANHGKTIRIPVHIRDRLTKLRKAYRCLVSKGHNPTLERVAKVAGEPVRLAMKALEVEAKFGNIFSLDGGEPDSFGLSFYNLVPHEVNADDEVEMLDFMIQVRHLLTKIPKREAEVIHMRVMQDMLLEEVGKVYGISRERVRQIQNRAIRRLRELMVFGVEQTKKKRGRKRKTPVANLEEKSDYTIQGQIQISQ